MFIITSVGSILLSSFSKYIVEKKYKIKSNASK